MQYGNWKMKTISGEVSSVFKSYYVVWKPKRTRRGTRGYVSFKSYYVVWKLGWSDQDERTEESLNRTMQYGNRKRWEEVWRLKEV